ncbi:MAG TPA: hypothetical protein VEK08_15060 [Planctomycetota bacterium]|nr:hypothetical protein [Planctomycetota bacterium]
MSKEPQTYLVWASHWAGRVYTDQQEAFDDAIDDGLFLPVEATPGRNEGYWWSKAALVKLGLFEEARDVELGGNPK